MLFLFGLVVTASPIVLPEHLPTQDGGGHYNTAMVLAGLASNARSFFERYFELRAIPPTNQVASQLMAWLAELTYGRQAERIVWGMLFAAFSAVIVINVRLLRPGAQWCALLLFPLFASVLVNLGFMNYLIGLILFIQGAFLLQFGLRRPSKGWAIASLGTSIATYFAHPLAGFALAATAGPLGVGYLIQAQRRGWRRAEPSFSPLFPLGSALACVALGGLAIHDAWPQILRLFTTMASTPGVASTSFGLPDTFRERLIAVFGLSYFVSFSPTDYIFSACYALVLLWLGRNWLRESRQGENAWLLPAATLLILIFLVPRRFEYYLPERLIPCLLTVLFIWWSGSPVSRSGQRSLIVIGLALNIGLLFWRLCWGMSIGVVLSEYASIAPMIPDRVSVVSIETAPSSLQLNCRAFRSRVLPCGFRPTLHFLGELIADRSVAWLTNYQLQPEAGFFPVALHAPWNAYTSEIGQLERWPPLPQERATPLGDVPRLIALLPPDVIVTWDDRRATGGPEALIPDTMPFLSGYTKVFTSHPIGAASVYVRDPEPTVTK